MSARTSTLDDWDNLDTFILPYLTGSKPGKKKTQKETQEEVQEESQCFI